MANDARAIPEEQWDLPVSIAPDGRWITLREFTEERMAALSFSNLSEQLSADHQAELVGERLTHSPDFEVAVIGLGIVNQERALQEVREQTPAGRTLINIELRTIARLIERASERDR